MALYAVVLLDGTIVTIIDMSLTDRTVSPHNIIDELAYDAAFAPPTLQELYDAEQDL